MPGGGGQPYVGEMMMVGFNFAPKGWAFCNGQLLSISQNEVLFQLIGTTFGATASRRTGCRIYAAACRSAWARAPA